MKRNHHPGSILVATDLSARCDRALDRAAQLSREWRAELVAVHAVDAADMRLAAHAPDERQALAAQRLRADLLAQGIDAAAHVVEGEAVQAVLHEARRAQAGLVVTGLARDEPFGRKLLGTTVERLARVLEVPLLTVRNRARGPYRRVVVATDLSPASVPALRTALHWFGAAHVTVFHACEPGTGDASLQAVADECRRFLAQAGLDDGVARRVRLVLEPGGVERQLGRYVRQHEADLVVLGTEGAGGIRKALLGSQAEALLRGLDCDVMVVRADDRVPAEETR